MKIEDAITYHKLWKTKLADYIANPDRSIRPEACHENCCEFTKWIQGPEASAYFDHPEFIEMQKAHKEFHRRLAEIIFNANRGVKISEDMAIGIDSPFFKQSEVLIKAMMRLKRSPEKDVA